MPVHLLITSLISVKLNLWFFKKLILFLFLENNYKLNNTIMSTWQVSSTHQANKEQYFSRNKNDLSKIMTVNYFIIINLI